MLKIIVKKLQIISCYQLIKTAIFGFGFQQSFFYNVYFLLLFIKKQKTSQIMVWFV